MFPFALVCQHVLVTAPGGPPPGGPPPGSPPQPAASAGKERNTTALLIGVIAALVVIILLLGAFLTASSDDDGEEAVTTTTEPPVEIFLEPVATAGPDPFTGSVAAADLPPVTPESMPSSVEGVAAVSGATPGLYGGTLDQSSCDADRMVEFLESDPGKAGAWAEAQGIGVDEIATFAAELTPVQLTNDTRVTNHGYSDGRPTPRQSVLQAGTAVLVDRYGVPRVRCACGNPLLEPVRTAAVYGGEEWVGWDPNRTVTVTVTVEVTEFVLVNVAAGGRIVRPVGTNGGSDSDPSATTTTAAPPPTAPPTPAPTVGSGPCPPGYAEIGGHCVDEFGNEPSGAG